jgi:hypothetical protein
MEAEPKGVLIIGANSVARSIGRALLDQGFRVKLTDTTWSELQAARMEGLETYYGNPVSAHADQHLELAGIGRLFAMSRRPELNTLACMKYRVEFGHRRVFTLLNAREKDAAGKQPVEEKYRVPRLFGDNVSLQKLSSLIAQGAEIKATPITREYSFDAYRADKGKQAILLFGIDHDGNLRPFTDTSEPPISAGWTVLALVPANESEKNA